MFGREIRPCSGAFLLVGFGMAFCLGRSEVSLCRAVFVVLRMVMVIFFWECTFPPLVGIREHPEFLGLVEMDKSCWPGCLLEQGWLPLLSGVNGWLFTLPHSGCR